MSEGSFSEYVMSGNKPPVDQIASQLGKQLFTNGDQGVSVSRDTLGNRVYTSHFTHVIEPLSKKDQLLSLVVSQEGVNILKKKPDLLRKMKEPSTDLQQLLPEGTESKNYLVDIDGASYVIKYMLPVRLDKLRTFTPGIDQMHALQLAQKELSGNGYRFIEPVLATQQALVAPFIPSIMSGDDLESTLYAGKPKNPLYTEKIPALNQLLAKHTRPGTPPPPYIRSFSEVISQQNRQVIQWVQGKIQTEQWIAKHLVPDVKPNCQIDVSKLIDVFDWSSMHQNEAVAENKEFVQRVNQAILYNELLSNTKDIHE